MTLKHIIFDLSEVLIAGLYECEDSLAEAMNIEQQSLTHEILYGPTFDRFMRGEITEKDYLRDLLDSNGWTGDLAEIKEIIRQAFHIKYDSTIEAARNLSHSYDLCLLSDHGREWVDYILGVHPFIEEIFPTRIYSFDLGTRKKDAGTFPKVLELLNASPDECLLIDDSAENIRSAARTGIPGICYVNHAQFQEEAKQRGIQISGISNCRETCRERGQILER